MQCVLETSLKLEMGAFSSRHPRFLSGSLDRSILVVEVLITGKNVRIGNNCSIFSSIIDDNVVIGDKTVIMEGSRIERGAVIAPHSVVPAGS